MDIYQVLAQTPASADKYGHAQYCTRTVWNNLGDALKEREAGTTRAAREQSITLRLDISGMSAIKSRLQSIGMFPGGYSEEFAEIMRDTAKRIAKTYNARYAYTQSDEITLLISPTRGDTEHVYAGRITKLVTTAAARASVYATRQLARIIERDAPEMANGMEDPVEIIFDCRAAVWDSDRCAFQLILWRAYDCGVNGISDACHHAKDLFKGTPKFIHRDLMSSYTSRKIAWLEEQGMLPLPAHQAFGTLFLKTMVAGEGYDPIKKCMMPVTRHKYVSMPAGNILTSVRNGETRIE